MFEKNHAVGTSGYGSVTMPADSTPYGDVEASMDYSETPVDLKEDLTPNTGARPVTTLDREPMQVRRSQGQVLVRESKETKWMR